MCSLTSDSNASDSVTDTTVYVRLTPPNDPPIKYSFSYDVIVTLDLYINCVIIQIMCVLGIGGNMVNILVISRHGFQETTNIVLTSLAVCDLLFSMTNCVFMVRAGLGRFDAFLSSTFSSYYVVYLFRWNQWSLSCSIGHVTIIAVERMLAVCFPFQVSRMVTVPRMVSAVTAVYVCNALMSVPLHLIFDFEWVERNNNTSYAVLMKSWFYRENLELIILFMSAVFNNLVLTLPLIVVFVCTSTIIVKISINRRIIKMSLAASCSRRDKKVVKSLLTVCVVFLVVVAPTSGLNVYVNVGPDSSVLSTEFRTLVAFIQGLMYQTSATVNFFIYLVTSSKFAGTYRDLLCFRYKL